MLRNVNDLRGYAIHATDGAIGEVDDLYFDDQDWMTRYLVVDTGRWLSGRKVLLSPLAIGHPDWMGRSLPVLLTRVQVERSPDIDTEKPVSRQYEAAYFAYYGYPNYWGGAAIWGMAGLTTERQFEADVITRRAAAPQTPDDCHLRSGRGVIGHHIHALDGDIGHVEDLLVDEHTWAIRYVIVATSNWWGGHHVLVAPPWITAVSWSEATVSVDLTRQAIKAAPPYDSAAQLDRQQEQGIFEHYGRPGYWTAKRIHDAATASAE